MAGLHPAEQRRPDQRRRINSRVDDPSALAQSLISRAHELGFALTGIATLEPIDRAPQLLDWLNQGKHGSMSWMESHTDLRTDPGRILDHAKSALVVADLYATRATNTDTPLNPGEGRIARYARGRDYHDTMKQRLHTLADELRALAPDSDTKCVVDTAPVHERELAQRAGLGWIGKHTLLIHPKAGSYMLLGALVTTLDLTPPSSQPTITDHCGSCTRCIDACPTHAITPYSVDATKCIAYLTIEHRTPIDPALHEGIGDWAFGCDICQEVCPHNSPRTPESLDPNHRTPNPVYHSTRDRLDLRDVLTWTPEDRSRELKGSAMKRAKLDMLKRNAMIVLNNQGVDFTPSCGHPTDPCP